MPTSTEIRPHAIESALKSVHDQKTFLKELLAETLNWPVSSGVTDVDAISYEWSETDLRAHELSRKLIAGRVLQVQLTTDQPWGIFILEFASADVFKTDRGMTGILRQVLRGLVKNRNKSGNLPSWRRENLLFFCTHSYEHFRIAHFEAPKEDGRTARLAAFGWGPDIPARTACEFNLNHLGWPDTAVGFDQWTEAFNVEKVTKRFYEDYAKEDKALRTIVAKQMGEKDIKAEPVKMFTQTLLNRLMFLRFIERKDWLTPPGNSISREYLKLLFAAGNYRGKSFYSGRLRKLFFEGLAVEGKQEFESIGKVPFLNGGLFEENALDEKVAEIPNEAFAALLGTDGLFYRYNFTVQESTPLDIEVAVDPEMLGKVFEELVTGRHESGSYYTPRPIVSFMCREALKGYLADVTKLPETTIAAFVDKHDTSEIGIPAAQALVAALNHLKAVDPACGSGAYLLGLLHEMVDLYRLLYSEKLKSDDRELHNLKLRIISNSIYGVDIDKFATNIAMLRLWLSLSVDSKKPLPLPNLEFKIETGDSLTGPDPSKLPDDKNSPDMWKMNRWDSARELIAKKRAYLECHDKTKAAKRVEIELKQELIAKQLEAQVGEGVIDWRVHFAEVFFRKPGDTTLDGKFAFVNEMSGVQRSFTDSEEAAGFDIVLANPPYIRQELIKNRKAEYKQNFPGIFTGGADICCYFYGRGVELLRPGGVLAFISSNKWMRAAYGKNLRSYLLRHTVPATIIDFGHTPVFPSADTFPCVPILVRRAKALTRAEQPASHEVFSACIFPRADYKAETPIGPYVRAHSNIIPTALLREEAWSLEDPHIQRLLERIRLAGEPLKDHCHVTPLRGILTGFNEAFIVDADIRARLIRDDPSCDRIIRPLLRGRDMGRWTSYLSGFFLITIGSSANVTWPWSGQDKAESVFRKTFPSVAKHLAAFKKDLEARQDQGHYWWELRSCDYLSAFNQPKLIWQEMAWFNRFSVDSRNSVILNTAYMLPTTDSVVMAILNSPIAWWYMWRTAQHGKDEVLRLIRDYTEVFPIPRVSGSLRSKIERLVSELAELSEENLPLQQRQLEIERELAHHVEDAFGLTKEEKEFVRMTQPPRDPIKVLQAKIDKAAFVEVAEQELD
jgi:type I restriction-modification system DNA methylase subunit